MLVDKEALTYELARRNFRVWLRFAKLEQPGQGAIPFEVWPHLEEVIQTIEDNRLVVCLKARQIGWSWIVAAYATWYCLYNPSSRVLLFSQGEDEAQKLLAKCKFILDHLPAALQRKVAGMSKGMIEFSDKGSWYIEALPSTMKAGRSDTVNLVVFDEADYHEYLGYSYTSAKPAADSVNGKIIMLSTPNPESKDLTFRQIFTEAPGNNFVPLYYSWRSRPGRDDEWLENIRKEYPDEYRFEKEYSETIEQALAPPSTLLAFSRDALDLMQTRPPITTDGVVNVWHEFMPGHRYIAASDTSHGVGQDYSVTIIMDTQTGVVVADIMSNTLSWAEFATRSLTLLEQYQSPVWAIESNDWGDRIIDIAEDYQYRNLYYESDKKAGFTTSGTRRGGMRNTMIGELIDAINTQQIVILSEKGLSHFYDCIRNPDKNGRIEAQPGGHDDYVMAVGIAYFLRDRARRSRDINEVAARERKSFRDRLFRDNRRKSLVRW